VQKLAADGLVEVGAHTMTHPVLSELSVNSQYVEIAESKRKLEEVLGQAVTSFSYPFGGQSDYNAATMKLVKKVGFSCACSNFPGYVRWGSDPYQLPRYLVRDWDGDEFQEQLMSWFVVPQS
jgi:peptidoglycan/xylan/chitin deacetylase (PgdA/CDA1 family)